MEIARHRRLRSRLELCPVERQKNIGKIFASSTMNENLDYFMVCQRVIAMRCRSMERTE
jgi:hypothetical protein